MKLYSGRRENTSRWRIQMTELRDFVPKFLPLYHLVAAVNSPTRYAERRRRQRAAHDSGDGGGGQNKRRPAYGQI